MSAPTTYARSQIWMHWTVVLLVTLQYLYHDPIGHAWHAALRGSGQTYDFGVIVHIASGLTILALMLARFWMRLTHGTPPPATDHRLLNLAGDLVHWAIYLVLVAMALSGLGAWFGMFRAAGETHEVLKVVLLVLIGLHVAGALFHQFILRDHLIARMMRSGR